MARVVKAEEKAEGSKGGIVDTIINSLTSNLKKQNKAADKNNTVRAKINAEATATDDALNVTHSALSGALKTMGKETKNESYFWVKNQIFIIKMKK